MKKLYSTIMMLAMMVAALSLTACGCSDDEDDGGNGNSSSLVGTWDIVRAVYYVEGEEPEYESGNGAYWVFTANKLTVHDSEDLMNGKSVDYTYRGNKLNIVGFPLYTVTEFTSSKLVIRSEEIYGSYNTVEFKKR
jgi:hypothetical protein